MHDLELDLLAFFERLIAIPFDGGEMDKNILSVFTLNKTEALGSREPLHATLTGHSIKSLENRSLDLFFHFEAGLENHNFPRGHRNDLARARVSAGAAAPLF